MTAEALRQIAILAQPFTPASAERLLDLLATPAGERDFFRDARPWGFILFARNIESPAQVRNLVSSLRETVGDAAAPILIDQEGGRVARLTPAPV